MFKKLLTVALITGFMFSCTSNATIETPAYAGVTLESIKQNCKPSNFWQMSVLTTPVIMIAYDKCMGVDTLIVLMTPYGAKSIDLERRTAQIVVEHFEDHKNNTDEVNNWKAVFLKDSTIIYEEIKSHVLFYSLESSKKSK